MKKLFHKKILIGLVLILIIFELNSILIYGFAQNHDIPGNSFSNEKIKKNQRETYNFTAYNVVYGILSDTDMILNVEINPFVKNRQLFFTIQNNNVSFTLNLNTETSLEQFEIKNQPKGPQDQQYQYQFRYENVIKLQANVTVQKVEFLFKKTEEYGLDPEKEYSIALFEENADQWNLLETLEKTNETTDDSYLEAEINNLDGNTSYFITIFELSPNVTDWTWVIVITIIVGSLALIVVISKNDYINFLLKRTIPVDKGAHQLTMEEVLENENRNKIIDLILDKPGVHFNEILREIGLSPGNLAWHLDILETYKVIGKKRVGRYLVYFPYYQKNPLSNIDLKLQKSELTLKVLEMIEDEPGIYNKKITNELEVDHKTIHYHINKLINLGLINTKKDGRKKKLYPNLDSEYFTNGAS